MLLQEALELLDHGRQRHPHSTGGLGEPWYTRRAIDLLDDLLKPDMYGFEWGGGASTYWLGQRLKHLFTVEHHPVWVERVQQALDLSDFSSKVDVIHKKLGEGYAEEINQFQNVQFDAIFIDGRERVACIQNAVPKLKEGGLLVIDNTERDHYGPGGMELMVGWPTTVTKNEKWETTIWVKP